MAASVHRIEVHYKKDPRLKTRTDRIRSLGIPAEELHLADVYTIATDARDFTREELLQIGSQLMNPVVQECSVDEPTRLSFDYAIEVGFLPGVTDNVGATARQTIEDFFSLKFAEGESVASSQLYFICGKLSEEELSRLASTLANPLVNRVHRKTRQEYGNTGMDVIVPSVKLHELLAAETVNLDIDDRELSRIGKEGIPDPLSGQRRGPLALDLAQMHAIRDYFKKNGRNPTDVELESLAQTWSEHCKHTIFASAMDDDVPAGLYKTYIQAATNKIREEKGENDICLSVFSDNSGAIIFDDQYLVTHKVETHNSPSALDPFGGALTGIVGVNRDTIGFGLGAKPCINIYGFCVGDPDRDPDLYRVKGRQNPVLTPRKILDGVVHGVGVGGNCSGIPTPQGFVYFDDRYGGKPLVFAGTVGIMPRERDGKKLYEKQAQAGDLIVVVGGRVGKDGIHGATFSSEALDPASPVTAVQIGDPITQKKFSDVIVKEARDLGLYRSITDNGAGGISCSVAEMAKECNGCRVTLDCCAPEISRHGPVGDLDLGVAGADDACRSPGTSRSIHGTDAAPGCRSHGHRGVHGSGRCVVEYHGKVVMDIELAFLHDGLPKNHLKTTYTKKTYPEPAVPCPERLDSTLKAMLQRRNICSKEFISIQYDHTVQGGHVLGPLQGRGRVQGVSSLTKVLPGSKKGVGLSQAMFPSYSEIDPYLMAAAGIDTAIRGLVALGIPPDRIAILDNFCWCSSDEPERLGQLKLAARGCYDVATAFGTPFISGKDSMYNDFSGFDAHDNPVKISVPPTLLISSIGVHDDVARQCPWTRRLTGTLCT